MADKTPEQNLKISERILEVRKKITALEEKETELTEKEQQELIKLEGTLSKILKFQEKRLKTSLGTYQAELDTKKVISGQASDLSSISSLYDGLTSKQKESLKTTQSIADSVKSTMLDDDTKKQILDSTLSGVTQLQALQQKMAETGPEDIETQQSIRDSYNAQLNQLREQITIKKGIGEINEEEAKALMQVLETQQGIFETAERYGTISSQTKDFLQKQLDVYKGIEKTIRGVLNTTQVLLSTGFGKLGAVLLGAGAAGKKLLDTSYQLGGSLIDTNNIATTLFGTVFEDAVGTTKSLSQEFGGLSDVSLTTQYRTNVLAKNLGIGADSAAKLTGSFARLNDGSAETAQNLIQSTKNLAEANGLVPSAVMADVAASAEEFALYGKDGGKNIAEAAVAAGKLGVSMKTLSGITDNLLDFESSINAELELGAMLGRNINLDRARALSYEGDIGGAVRETLSALGGIEEFNRMDYFQKKQTAALLGVSVEEFQKMADNADKLGKNGEIIPTQYEAALNTMKAFGSQLLSGVQTLGSMAVAAGQMGFNLKDGLSSMKEMGGLGGTLKKLFGLGPKGPLKADGTPDMRFKANKKVKTPTPTKSLTDSANPAKKGGMLDSMSKINMSAVLKGAAALVIVAAAVLVFGIAVQQFAGVEQAILPAIGAMFAMVGALALLGTIMSSPIGAGVLIGAAAMVVLASSLLILGYALQGIGKGFDALSTGLSSLAPNISGIAETIGGLVILIPSIALLSYSIMGLSASLMALGVASLIALPALTAVSAVGGVVEAVNSIFGGGEEGGAGGDSVLLEELRGLRKDLTDGKVAVYIDGKKVTAAVSTSYGKQSYNSYAT